jgi:non-heme chloroperoxidase
MKIPLRSAVRSLSVVLCVAGLAIGLGGPGRPAPMSSVNNPFKDTEYADIPAVQYFASRDGSRLAFREYSAKQVPIRGSVVLIHGSAGRSNSMHVMGRSFAQAGYLAYALDMRGHGNSGFRGHIDYIGELENDVEDFMNSVSHPGKTTLVGFSSGGGFVLRFAASERQKLFSNYLLLSPFLSQDSPTYRPNSGGWVSVGLPRVIAITVLNTMHITAFNDLPVINFALDEADRDFLTPQYSFALEENFRPHRDYRADIRSANQPMEVLAGQDDEAFHVERFAEVFRAEGKSVPVTIIPKIGHIALTLNSIAVQVAVSAVTRLDEISNLPSYPTLKSGAASLFRTRKSTAVFN